MPVIATFKLDGDIASGEASRYAEGAHGGLGTGVHQAHQFHGRYHFANGLGHLDFLLGRCAEAGSPPHGFLQSGENFRMPVPDQQRPPGPDVIDELIAIGIENMRRLSAHYERGRTAH